MYVLSGGLGMANHVGAGASLSATAFDWPRILPTFFRLKKLVAEGKSADIYNDKVVLLM